MASPFDFLLERVAEIEALLGAPETPQLERICTAALKIVLAAPSGYISKAASTVATNARLWSENPIKRELYEPPLRSAVKNLRQALQTAEPHE